MKRYFIVFFILLLAGCATHATHNVANIPAESEQISLEPLQVEIDYEAYLLRIDLIRQTTQLLIGRVILLHKQRTSMFLIIIWVWILEMDYSLMPIIIFPLIY